MFEELIELVVARGPLLALIVQPPLDGGVGFGVEFAGPDPSHLLGGDEASVLQRPDVLCEWRQGHVEGRGKYWREFAEQVNGLALDAKDEQAVRDGAVNAFAFFRGLAAPQPSV